MYKIYFFGFLGSNPLQQQSATPSFTGLVSSSTSGSLFNPATPSTSFPVSTGGISSLNQSVKASSGFFNQKSSQQPSLSSTTGPSEGFNFGRFNSSGPNINFGNNSLQQQGPTIFGTTGPPTSNPTTSNSGGL